MKALGIPLRRPVATGACYAVVLLLGLAALQRLPIALTPELDFPRLTVSLNWPDASSEMMEGLVTSKVEAEANRLPGVREVSSVSGRGFAQVALEFERGTRMDRAELLLGDRMATLRDRLPRNVSPPVIERWLPGNLDAETFFAIQASGDHTADALRDLLEDRLTPALLAIEGVSAVTLYGGSERELRVDLDPKAVERGMVDAGALGVALEGMAQDVPLGASVVGGHRLAQTVVRTEPTASALRHAVVGGSPDSPVRLGDVASVTDTRAEPVRIARLNGRPSAQIVLEREAATNLVQVAASVREALDALRPSLPSGVTLKTVHDSSESIRKEISVLARRASLSVLLILLVLVASSGRFRPSAVVLGSVLFSALGTFLLFRILGLGIDLVTLSGLALAFGMAVDNAIVLQENIALRRRRESETAGGTVTRLRTLAAVREVLFPLVAGTLTTAVVLTPFLYLSGELRDYYLPFVLAVCLSLGASLAVALTLTPLLSRWALAGRGEGFLRVPGPVRAVARALGAAVERVLGAVFKALLRRRWITAFVALALLAGSVWVFQNKVSTGSIFPPNTDTQLSVSIGLAPGAEIAQTEALISGFENAILSHDFFAKRYIDQVETLIGENRAALTARFIPQVARTTIPAALKEELILRASTISGANVGVSGSGPGYFSGGGNVSASYQLRVSGPDYIRLAELAEDVGRRLQRHGRIADVNTNASSWIAKDAIEFVATPDRDLIAELGVPMRRFTNSLQPAIAGSYADRRLRSDDGELNATIRFTGADRMTPTSLATLGARTPSGVSYPLGNALSVSERAVQGEIHRRNQEYERLVTFEFRGPRRVGNRYVESFVEGTELPAGYTLKDGLGVFLTSREERQIHGAIALALLLIYMVSAALFESLLLPFVAILSVPLSFTGIALVFWITGETFDRTAYIGLILLAGIAINNALLLVHRAGALHRSGRNAIGAAARAARERARPILLTTATSLAGLAPLAFGNDPTSAASWRTLALSASAGLLASAICTLGVIPALFSLFVRGGGTPDAVADA